MEPKGCNPFSDHDVLTGRDRLALTHPGNLYYRDLCRSYKKLYNESKRRSEKSDAIHSIVEAVKRRGGRFMTLDDLSGDGMTDWIVMDEDSVHRKVSHNLRHRSMSKAQEVAAKLGANGEGKDRIMKAAPARATAAASPSKAKLAAALRGRRQAALATSMTLEANSRRPSLRAMQALAPLPNQARESSPPQSGASAPRRQDASGQLYLFDARFRESFVRHLMDSTHQMCAVTYQIVRGSTTEVRGANLVMRVPPPLRYGP